MACRMHSLPMRVSGATTPEPLHCRSFMIDSDISSPKAWRPAQAYGMAVVCLLLGLPVGYFIRGSAQAHTPVRVAASNPSTVTVPEGHPAMDPSTTEQKMPTLDDMKRMA